MTIYKRNSTKEEQKKEAREIARVDEKTPYSFKVATNNVLKQLLEESNELNLPKKLIKTKNNGEISLRLIANIAATGRTKELIAKTLGMTPRNFRYLCDEHPEIDDAIAAGHAIIGNWSMDTIFTKIETNDDKGNKLLDKVAEEFAGFGRKSIKVEHTGADGDDIQVNIKSMSKSIMSKVFSNEDLIDAEYEEVEDDKDE